MNKYREAAIELATKHFEDETWGPYPKIEHMIRVADAYEKFFNSWSSMFPQTVAVAVLHDIFEDTQCTYEEIEEFLHPFWIDRIYMLTDKPGKNRRERHEATYPIIAKDHAASFIKLCDRIVNVELCSDECRAGGLDVNYSYWKMYKKEQAAFKSYFDFPNEPEWINAMNYLDLLLETNY